MCKTHSSWIAASNIFDAVLAICFKTEIRIHTSVSTASIQCWLRFALFKSVFWKTEDEKLNTSGNIFIIFSESQNIAMTRWITFASKWDGMSHKIQIPHKIYWSLSVTKILKMIFAHMHTIHIHTHSLNNVLHITATVSVFNTLYLSTSWTQFLTHII